MATIRNNPALLFLLLSILVHSCTFENKKSQSDSAEAGLDSVDQTKEVAKGADSISQGWSKLPEVMPLAKFKQTELVPTLENAISKNKNVLYASAFLFAWDKVEEALHSPINVTKLLSTDVQLLTKSTSHQNSLTDKEYTTTVEVSDIIEARSIFNKALPFETKLQVIQKPLRFDKMPVAAFGMEYYDSEIMRSAQILYYLDDDHFILKLAPKDDQHEIILVKGLNTFANLKEAVKQSEVLIKKGQAERTSAKLSWKYKPDSQDMFAIPILKLHIDAHYTTLEDQHFSTKDNTTHTILTAYQRIGFIFNENGAEVESEAYASADSAGVGPVVILTQPKKMVFDKPFLIILKRTDQTNPYFVMHVVNAELLTKK